MNIFAKNWSRRGDIQEKLIGTLRTERLQTTEMKI